MRSIQALEAKANLADILDAVEQGESILISRNGRVVARVIPEEIHSQQNLAQAQRIKEAMANIKALRSRMSRMTIDDIVTVRHEGLA